MHLEYTKSEFLISTDKQKLDLQVIHQFLGQESYWAKDIPLEIIEKAIENPITYGIYHLGKQVGFGRITTDKAVFAYIGDVFVIEACRKKSLSKWMIECMLQHPELQTLRKWMLGTKDAHTLYEKFGFKAVPDPENVMELRNNDIYQKLKSQK
jgi:N-acetylglutamate synthase-like GNAT family acetyltransferase